MLERYVSSTVSINWNKLRIRVWWLHFEPVHLYKHAICSCIYDTTFKVSVSFLEASCSLNKFQTSSSFFTQNNPAVTIINFHWLWIASLTLLRNCKSLFTFWRYINLNKVVSRFFKLVFFWIKLALVFVFTDLDSTIVLNKIIICHPE